MRIVLTAVWPNGIFQYRKLISLVTLYMGCLVAVRCTAFLLYMIVVLLAGFPSYSAVVIVGLSSMVHWKFTYSCNGMMKPFPINSYAFHISKHSGLPDVSFFDIQNVQAEYFLCVDLFDRLYLLNIPARKAYTV
jgi:hypothetical protein